MISLKEKYNKEVIPAMMEKFNYKNRMAVPEIEKVVINVGFGKMISGKGSDEQRKNIKSITDDLALITGQKAMVTKAKKSVAGFKLREGSPVGAMVVLRRQRMFDFLERLINIVLPRSRDFSGIKLDSFDKKGNLTLAVKEHISFPEILPERTKVMFSLEITTVTSTQQKDKGMELLRLMGFPLKKA